MPQVSVVVTSYNIEKYLEECLESIISQTLRDIEIIVVDDGSSDSTPAIIKKYAELDSRIIPVLLPTNSPGGVATAANAGLDRATAPYVGFADGDDVCDPEMFERLLQAALDHDADLSMCKYREFVDSIENQKVPADEHRWLETPGSSYELDVETRSTFLRFIAVPWRKLYRRALLESNQIRFPVGDYFFEDNPFHWFSLLSADSIALVPEVLCYHRVARPGQTMASADERLLRMFEHHETIFKYLEAKQVSAQYDAVLLGWAMSQMEWISRRTPAELSQQLYEKLTSVFDHYSSTDVERALLASNKGAYATQLSKAVKTHNYQAFLVALKDTPRERTLATKVLGHLKHSGLRGTARLAVRHARRRFGKIRTRVGNRPDGTLSNEHLLFAITALAARVERIETRLREAEQASKPTGGDGAST